MHIPEAVTLKTVMSGVSLSCAFPLHCAVRELAEDGSTQTLRSQLDWYLKTLGI